MDDLIKAVELAEKLRICRKTLERLIKQTDFPKGRKLGKKVLVWRISEVNAWLDAQ